MARMNNLIGLSQVDSAIAQAVTLAESRIDAMKALEIEAVNGGGLFSLPTTTPSTAGAVSPNIPDFPIIPTLGQL